MSNLEKLCASKGIRIYAVFAGETFTNEWKQGRREWLVSLRLQRRNLTVPFFQGMGHTKAPTSADVLSCLISDAQAGAESFEGFCSNFGYDADSRKAEATWKTCIESGAKVRALLGDSFEEFEQAAQDH